MKIIYSIIIFSSFLHADFDSSVSYAVQVKDNNLWGVGNSQSINNNKGKSGLITGTATSLSVCPCLSYGVNSWSQGTTIPYNYTDADQQKVIKNQQQASVASQGPCAIVPSSSGQKIDMEQVFDQAYTFVENIDTVINTIVNLFPDITQGQGYESAAFLNFCTTSTSLIERINTTNQQLFAWAHFEKYFQNAVFRLALDLREPVPTAQAIQSGNAFAFAIIDHYSTLLKILHPASGSTPVTTDIIIQKEEAIKNALLW